jgi:dynein heavy chain 1, cytosolic
LTQARGEALIEDFLAMSKETWKTRELEMTRFKQKCKLVRGWEDLRNGIDEHIANIASMKMSPYYKVFQEQIEPWDEKLQKMMLIFDTW